jgi:hypothetical protein
MTPEATTTGAAAGPAAVETETVSATRAAADAGDVSKFLDADREARAGKAPARVERPKASVEEKRGAPGRPNAASVAGKSGEPAKGPTAADRDADERLTARIREAVDTATAGSKAEIDALRRQLAEKAPAGEPTNTPAKTEPAYKRYLAMPDAPKVEEFESVLEFNAAVSHFIAGKMHAEELEAGRAGAAGVERTRQELKRVETFQGRIKAYKDADPTFSPAVLSPDVRQLHGFSKLAEINEKREAAGQPALPATVDHAIAENMYDSEYPGQIARYLSDHPEELATLRACANPRALDRAFVRLEGKVSASPAADKQPAATTTTQTTAADAEAVVDRSVTKHSPPAPTFGKAGSAADPFKQAVEKGDVGMFLQLDREQMAAKRGLSR